MSTYDTTVSMLKALPENDLRKVLSFIRESFFFGKETPREVGEEVNPFSPVSEDAIFERLEATRKRVENGDEPLMEAHYASTYVREKYGIRQK